MIDRKQYGMQNQHQAAEFAKVASANPVHLPEQVFRVTWTQAHVTRNSHPANSAG
jgi:hypothetical protein